MMEQVGKKWRTDIYMLKNNVYAYVSMTIFG